MNAQTLSLEKILAPALRRNPSLRMELLQRCIVRLMRALGGQNTLREIRQTLQLQLCVYLTDVEMLALQDYMAECARMRRQVQNMSRKRTPVRPTPVLAALVAGGALELDALRITLPKAPPPVAQLPSALF